MVIKMNVPKLRFKEFSKEWSTHKLSDLTELTSSKRIYLNEYKSEGVPFYRGKEISELKKGNKINDLLFISNEKYEEIKQKYGTPQINDILITSVGTLGNVYRIKSNDKFYFKDGNLIWLKNIRCNSKFLEYSLEYNKKKMLDSSIGSTQKALTIEGLSKIKISLPSEIECKKIGNILSLLDKKIELQSKKIEALKLYKKGLINLVKNDWKNWKNYKISDIFKITRGVVIPKNKISEEKNEIYKYPVYSSQTSNNGILGYDKIYDYNGKYLTWTTDGANAGKVFYRDGKFRCTNVCGILYEDNPLFTNEFVCELLNYETPKHVSYIGNPKLMNNVMENINLKLPNNDILIKTAKLISLFNKKLENENDKLIKLHNLKKGLMQNMFV